MSRESIEQDRRAPYSRRLANRDRLARYGDSARPTGRPPIRRTASADSRPYETSYEVQRGYGFDRDIVRP